MLWRSCLSFLLLISVISSDASFVFPPAFVPTTNFSSNLVLVEGDFEIVQWRNVSNTNNARISVSMFRFNGTSFFGAGEYVIQNTVVDTVSTSWTVNTAKNLTLSPMFFLTFFLEGETTGTLNSHYFNISAKSTTTASTVSASSVLGSASTAGAANIGASATGSQGSTSALTAGSTSAAAPPIVTISPSLGTGTKVGIVIGVLGSALFGLCAGWLSLRRRMKVDILQVPPPLYGPAEMTYHEPPKPNQCNPYEVIGEVLAPIVYELSPETRQ